MCQNTNSKNTRPSGGKWWKFTAWISVHSNLYEIQDIFPILQIFSKRVRAGFLEASIQKIFKCSVDKYLHLVGHIFTAVGTVNPIIDALVHINFSLCQQLAKYQNDNPTTTCIHLIPLSLLLHLNTLYSSGTPAQCVIYHLVLLVLIFLLHPIKYFRGGSNTLSTPFRLYNVTFFIGPQCFLGATTNPNQLNHATFNSLTFKNKITGSKARSWFMAAASTLCLTLYAFPPLSPYPFRRIGLPLTHYLPPSHMDSIRGLL